MYPNTDSVGYVNWTDRGPASFPVHPWWIGSVAEAVFLLGAERNSEKIIGAAYVSIAVVVLDVAILICSSFLLGSHSTKYE